MTKPLPNLITITQENQGRRLDKFLAEILTGQTRSQIKKLIKSGQISVNGKTSSVHHFLKIGDTISISRQEKKELETKSTQSLSPNPQPLIPNIIFEDDNFLVINKLAGLLVHPTNKGETDTLVNWLIKKYPTIKNVGGQQYRDGIIHRLDRDVSGAMIVAKTEIAFLHLKNQFKKRKVKKEYVALVYGKIDKQEGEINLPIGRNANGQFVAHPRRKGRKFESEDKLAKTRYQVLEYLKDYTLLAVQILTGRTHQIRAHLSAIGHPIIGDKLYQPRKKIFHFLRRKIKVIDPGRIFLHSVKIGFYDLNNDWREFESAWPEPLTKFLDEKRK